MKRILVADDDSSILNIISLRLKHEGFDVVVASDGQAVMGQISKHKEFDLIVLDIRMPKLTGLDVAKLLRKDPKTAGIPIILISASTASWKKVVQDSVNLGISECLRKPFQTEELLKKIYKGLQST